MNGATSRGASGGSIPPVNSPALSHRDIWRDWEGNKFNEAWPCKLPLSTAKVLRFQPFDGLDWLLWWERNHGNNQRLPPARERPE
jgi:hypothetical protein